MKASRIVPAVLAGVVLGSMPWWRYAAYIEPATPHADHEPRHGGELAMAGDHHIELHRRGTSVEVYVSDASRRPVEPRAVALVIDGATSTDLRWDGYRFVGTIGPEGAEYEVQAQLEDRSVTATFLADRP